MNGYSSFILKMLRELQGEDLSFETFSEDYIKTVTYRSKRLVFIGDRLGLNSDAATAAANDKSAAYELLSRAGLPAVPHADISSPRIYAGNINNLFNEIEHAYEISDLIDGSHAVVIKPNLGKQGRDVFLDRTPEDAKKTADKLLDHYDTIAISPFIAADFEYRCTVLNGKTVFIYQKSRDQDWRFNLHHGSIAKRIKNDDPLAESLMAIAGSAARAVGCRFSNVDIFSTNNGLKILEINPTITFTLYLKQHPEDLKDIKNIFKKALDLLVEDA